MTDPGTPTPASPRRPAPCQVPAGAADASPPGFLQTAAPTLLVFLITICIVTDLVSDIATSRPLEHMVGMIAGTILSMLCLGLMWRLLRASRARARTLEVALDVSRADVVEWRSKAEETLHGLGALIDRQFEAWGLSPAEREVGLLLLKGLSLKDVAAARETTERTARQQALTLYHKAGLAGRAELSAFFLEDLLLPPSAAGGDTSLPVAGQADKSPECPAA